MAVNKVPAGTVLRLKLQVGVDEQGNPKYQNKNLRYVKPEAVDQELLKKWEVRGCKVFNSFPLLTSHFFNVAQSLAGLQEYTLVAVQREANANLGQA